MPFVAEASIFIQASPEAAFDKLADHASWSSWMPKNFRPRGASSGPLKVGAKLRVAILRVPVPIEVFVVERPSEITWGGGTPLLSARHRFLFEAEGKGTRVRSVETWEGPTERVMRHVVKPVAERLAGEQLAALKRAIEG